MTVTMVPERPTAVIETVTTWKDFPSQWKPMLDQVYASHPVEVALRMGVA